MFFDKIENLLKQNLEIGLNDLVYSSNMTFKMMAIDFLKRHLFCLSEDYYFERVLKQIILSEELERVFDFFRYYLEFPIITGTLKNGKIISDYHYLCETLEINCFDITNEVTVETDFRKLELINSGLLVEGTAFIPFVDMNKKEDVRKKIILKSLISGVETIIDTPNEPTDELLEKGFGVNYYTFAGLKQLIDLKGNTEVEISLEISIPKENFVKRQYCFEIRNGKISVDLLKKKIGLNEKIFPRQPRLVSADAYPGYLTVKIDSPYRLVEKSLRVGNHILEDYEVITEDYHINNILYKNGSLVRYYIDCNKIDFGDHFIFMAGEKIAFPSVEKKVILSHSETNRTVKLYSNSKGAIELHIKKTMDNYTRLKKKIGYMENSFSWKVTQPLRTIKKFIKR